MKLFLISQQTNNKYDTYDSAVVCAPDELTARHMDPSSGEPMNWGDKWSGWCKSVDDVEVEYLGEAAEGVKQRVVCSSYNAG